MKYIVVLADGMSDYKIPELGDMTPIEKAKKDTILSLAKGGEVFSVKTVPDKMKPGSDVANLSVMGYDPELYYTGRSPLEAASIGVELSDNQTAFRANLVSLGGDGDYSELSMKDYSAGEISSEEASEIIETLAAKLGTDKINLYAGVSYRHLLVWENAPEKFSLTPPHDISGKPIKNYLPSDDTLLDIMVKSREILKHHPVNVKRRAEGKNTADSLWIWGEGKKPSLSSFEQLFGKSGAVISAVDLIKGIGRLAGMKVIDVPGATGNIDTNFKGKACAAVETLKEGTDFVYIHVEAPDECGHRGEAENKTRAIELIDSEIIAYVKAEMEKAGYDFKIMVLPDHPTPISTKTHAGDPVPCVIYDSTNIANNKPEFSEQAALGRLFGKGDKLMNYFLGQGEFVE